MDCSNTTPAARRLDLKTLAWCALSLDERRIAVDRCEPDATASGDRGTERLARWCRAVAAGNAEAFRRRLAWEGLDTDRARVLVDDAPPVGFEPPPWASRLEQVVERLESEPTLSLLDALAETAAPAFRENASKLAPFVTEQAVDDCVSLLRRDLVAAAPARLGPLDRMLGAEGASRFVEVCQREPVLARALLRAGERWRVACFEMLERCWADRDVLVRLLDPSLGAPSRLDRVDAGLSDGHDSGRRVAILHLRGTDGAPHAVVYKPRPLAIERALHDLVADLSTAGACDAASALPRPLAVLDRGAYGWMERVEAPAAGASPAEATAYFRRAGGLLCLVSLLRADDLHAENVVASVDGPAILDAETLLQPAFVPTAGRSPLVSTQLLTSPQIDAAGRPYDLGGLRGRSPDPSVATSNRLRRLAPREASRTESGSRPGAVHWPEDQPEALLDGYATVYRALLDARPRWRAPGGPLRRLADVPVRALYRSSDVYGGLLRKLAEPSYRRSGAAASILLEALARPVVLAGGSPESASTPPAAWQLAASERRALLDGDVPVVRLPAGAARPRPGSRDIADSVEQPIEPGSGLDRALRALDALSPAQLERESASLDRLLAALRRERRAVEAERECDAPLLDAARRVAARLDARADALGSVWLLPDSQIDAAGPPRSEVSAHLYDGGPGVAVFLAHLGAITGDARHFERAAEALEPLARALEGAPSENATPEAVGLGLGHGLGGWVWAAVRIAAVAETCPPRLAPEEANRQETDVWAGHLRDRADRLAEQAADRLVVALDALGSRTSRAAHQQLDLSMGLAGAVVGLASLASRRPRWCARAFEAGDALLARVGDPKRWPPGLAHGAGGVALALRRLEHLAGPGESSDPSAWGLAAGAFEAREASLYDPTVGGWPVDGDRRRGFATSWCHGSAGIGAARLATAGFDRAHRAALDGALASILSTDPDAARLDHFCCGEAGRIDFLVDAAELLARPALRRLARARAASLAERVDDSLRLDESVLSAGDGGRDGVAVGLFRGLAGIGWALLRAAVPGLPSLGAFALPADRSAS